MLRDETASVEAVYSSAIDEHTITRCRLAGKLRSGRGLEAGQALMPRPSVGASHRALCSVQFKHAIRSSAASSPIPTRIRRSIPSRSTTSAGVKYSETVRWWFTLLTNPSKESAYRNTPHDTSTSAMRP